MLSWVAAGGYGAAGGVLMEAVAAWRHLEKWQRAAHQAISDGRPRPALKKFIDLQPDVAAAITRAVLGCVAGWLLRSEVTGMYAALAVGASAPALLASLGGATTIAEIPAGHTSVAPSEDVRT